MAHTNAWNEAKPAGSDLASSIDDQTRQMKLDIRERMQVCFHWNEGLDIDGKMKQLVVTTPPDNQPIFGGGGNTITGDSSVGAFQLSQTWNTTGMPTFMKLDLTDQASHVDSKFLEFWRNAFSVFRVYKDGRMDSAAIHCFSNLTVDGNATIAGHITSDSVTTNHLGVTAESTLQGPVAMNSGLSVTGTVTIVGDLHTTGTTYGDRILQGSETVNGPLIVNGPITANYPGIHNIRGNTTGLIGFSIINDNQAGGSEITVGSPSYPAAWRVFALGGSYPSSGIYRALETMCVYNSPFGHTEHVASADQRAQRRFIGTTLGTAAASDPGVDDAARRAGNVILTTPDNFAGAGGGLEFGAVWPTLTRFGMIRGWLTNGAVLSTGEIRMYLRGDASWSTLNEVMRLTPNGVGGRLTLFPGVSTGINFLDWSNNQNTSGLRMSLSYILWFQDGATCMTIGHSTITGVYGVSHQFINPFDAIYGGGFLLTRNPGGTYGAPGFIDFYDRVGVIWAIWVDAAGKLRIRQGGPPHYNEPDNVGVLVGSQV